MRYSIKALLLSTCLLFRFASSPAAAQQLRVDDLGIVSLRTEDMAGDVRFLALEGRNLSGDCWRPIAQWNLTGSAQNLSLETAPGADYQEYRLIYFGPAGPPCLRTLVAGRPG